MVDTLLALIRLESPESFAAFLTESGIRVPGGTLRLVNNILAGVKAGGEQSKLTDLKGVGPKVAEKLLELQDEIETRFLELDELREAQKVVNDLTATIEHLCALEAPAQVLDPATTKQVDDAIAALQERDDVSEDALLALGSTYTAFVTRKRRYSDVKAKIITLIDQVDKATKSSDLNVAYQLLTGLEEKLVGLDSNVAVAEYFWSGGLNERFAQAQSSYQAQVESVEQAVRAAQMREAEEEERKLVEASKNEFHENTKRWWNITDKDPEKAKWDEVLALMLAVQHLASSPNTVAKIIQSKYGRKSVHVKDLYRLRRQDGTAWARRFDEMIAHISGLNLWGVVVARKKAAKMHREMEAAAPLTHRMEVPKELSARASKAPKRQRAPESKKSERLVDLGPFNVLYLIRDAMAERAMKQAV